MGEYYATRPKPQPSGILHQETTTVTSDTALAEIMTNLIGMFIVAWDGNAFSVLNAEQPVVSPIVHRPSKEEQVYNPRDTATTIPQGLVTPPLDQDLNRVFVNTLLIIFVISLQHVSKTLFQLYGARLQSSVRTIWNET